MVTKSKAGAKLRPFPRKAWQFVQGILVPPSTVGRAGMVGAIAGVMLASVYMVLTSYMSSPLGLLAGVLIVTAALLPGALTAMLVYGLLKLLSSRVFSGMLGLVTGLLIVLSLIGYPLLFAMIISLAIVPFLAALFALIVKVTRSDFRTASSLHKSVIWLLLTIVLVTGITGTIWYNHEGTDAHLVHGQVSSPSSPPALQLPDPSGQGPYQVSKLYYGSGTDLRRKEYGEGVHLVTSPVDVTPFLPELSAFRLRLRERYWGFDLSQSPVNGRVWYPEGAGPFPLVLIVHGNHEMTDFSDPGYAYLGELLASRGYIAVSVDQNFLNGSFFAGDLTNTANVARGWMLLEHLRVWREWQHDDISPFYGKVDMENIALIGHSRGGEAVAIAAALNKLTHYPDNANIEFDYEFGIKSLVAIAPVDESYTPAGRPVPLEDVNYLLIHGAHDGDVAVLMGNRQYQRTTFSGQDYRFKSVLYVYQANHGQFNTGWGRRDMRLPLGKLLNVKPLMPETEQRQIAKVYISAFLEATMKGELDYTPLFQDHRTGSAWLHETIVLSRFQDSTFRVISDYEEDFNPVTTTVMGGAQQGVNFTKWKEGPLLLRAGSMKQSNNVVFLTWNQEENEVQIPSYNIVLPHELASDWELAPRDVLTFSMVDLSQGSHPVNDVTIQVQSSDGITSSVLLGELAPIIPPLEVRFTKLGFIEGMLVDPVEPVLQTYEIPLQAFLDKSPEIDPSTIMEIRFIFGHSTRGEVALDDIGFRRPD